MRVFFAIEFEEHIKEQLNKIQKKIKEVAKGGNYTRQPNFHLTLEFIGEVSDEQLTLLKEVLGEVGHGRRTFTLNTTGIGSFKRGNEHIVWLGLERHPDLNDLVEDLTKTLKKTGFRVEERPYKAHITLGRRIKIEEQELRSLCKHKIDLDVSKISLMESKRVNETLIYEPRASITLKFNDEEVIK